MSLESKNNTWIPIRYFDSRWFGNSGLTNVNIVHFFSGTVYSKVKVSHYKPWRPMGDVDAKVHIYTATALERDRVASPTLGRFYPGKSPLSRYSFYRKLWGLQDQSGHEGAKKNLHPSDTRNGTRTTQPVAKSLVAWAIWLTLLTVGGWFIYRLFMKALTMV